MRQILCATLLIVIAAGCGNDDAPSDGYGESDPYGYGDYYSTGEITFLDTADANAPLDAGISELKFVDINGQETGVTDYANDQHIVLVVTRGNTDPICPYCSTQTSHYIRDYDQFTERNTEVLVVYPIETQEAGSALDAFLTDARGRLSDPDRPVPFPVLLDVELTAVNQLGIKQDLSKPATYILDRTGRVRYAYVGNDLADRPSVAVVLQELDKINSESQPVDDQESVPNTSAVETVPSDVPVAP